MYNPQLETFLRVADAGSFSRAAEEAYITPTAVIKQINLLEESLGVKLFDRTHRGLTLTKAGRSLYQDAKYIIQYCRDSVARAKNAMLEDTNVIRVGSSPMTPAQILMQLWSKVNETCPDIKFQIVPFENTPENAREILGKMCIRDRYFSWYSWGQLLFPALITLVPTLIFALGSGWLLGQVRPWLVYVWMVVPFGCMARCV